MDDTIKVIGNLEIIKKDKDDKIVETRSVPNLVVNAGKAYIASRLVNNPTSNIPKGMALGESAATTTGAMTALTSEVGRISGTNFSNVISSNTITFTGVFGGGVATSSGLREAAILDQPVSGGTMLCRTTFAAVTKGGSDSITVNWNITIA